METLLHDVRYALRTFAKARGFTAVALLTLATAIGANATVFSFVNALLFRPPAGVDSPGSLVSIFTSDFSSGPYGNTSIPDFHSIKAEAGAFGRLAAFREDGATLVRVGDEAERVRVMAVTGDFFQVVGVAAITGRVITEADATAGASPAVVIGHTLWQRAFGSDAAAVGSVITIDGRPRTIIGVTPPGFTGLNLGAAFDIWTPLVPRADGDLRGDRSTSVVGRLAAGNDLVQGQAQLDGIAARLGAAYPSTNFGTLAHPDRPRAIIAVPHTQMHPSFRGQVAMIATVLLVAVALVLLIACANIAGLLLARATARQREIAVRLALGASRGRLVRQMLTESLILGIAGGALGLLVALWAADALPSFFPAEQQRLLDSSVDWRVLSFTAIVALASGLVFGVAPAFQGLKAAAASALRSDAGRSGEVRSGLRARRMLVMSQVALASVLLVSAVLLTRSLTNALNADLGFTTRQAVLVSLEGPSQMTAAATMPYFTEVLAAVRRLPGIEDAALARSVPVAGVSRRGFRIDGYVPAPNESTEFHYNVVSQEFFATMGIRARSGRVFEDADRAGRPVAVVNHILEDRYFNGNAVGRQIRDSRGLVMDIVGVVRADRRLDLDDPPRPVVFYLADQQVTARMILVARTSGDPSALADTVRRTIVPINRDVAVFRTVTLEDHLNEALSANRLTVALVVTCGILALALALIGLYGIVSYTVVRRTREIGVRMALGATPWQVLRLLLADNGATVGLGLLAGMAAAMGATRLLGSMLYGISPTDGGTYLMVLSAVALVAVVASVLPATRALRVNPVTALRHD